MFQVASYQDLEPLSCSFTKEDTFPNWTSRLRVPPFHDDDGRRYLFDIPGHASWIYRGPHLFKRNGYYCVLTAECGIGWGHAARMPRSRKLTGPYELHPDRYILASRHRPDPELHRAGYADLVGATHLNRETAIEPMVWADGGWLHTADGADVPYSEVAAPAVALQGANFATFIPRTIWGWASTSG